MAKSKKRASVRRGKAGRRSKASQRVKSAVKSAKKTVRRNTVRAKPKKAASKTRAKRPASSRAKPSQQRAEPPIEVIRIETVDKPAPGTVIVTEYEEVRVPSGGSITGQTRKQGGPHVPDPEEGLIAGMIGARVR